MQRLLLINPLSSVYATSRIKAGITYVPQVSLAMLGAVAEQAGHEVRVLDLSVPGSSSEEFVRLVGEFQPTVLGITVMTPNYGSAAGLAGLAKETCPDVLVVAGGAHASSLDEELFRLLKKAGCHQVALAPETDSPELLQTIHKGITLDDCRQAFRYAKKAKLRTVAFFMIALPGETPETIEQTINFARELSPDYAKVCFAPPCRRPNDSTCSSPAGTSRRTTGPSTRSTTSPRSTTTRQCRGTSWRSTTSVSTGGSTFGPATFSAASFVGFSPAGCSTTPTMPSRRSSRSSNRRH